MSKFSDRALPTLNTEDSLSYMIPQNVASPTISQRPLSIYNLKINVSPLGNRLSGGQRVYLSQAFTIKPNKGRAISSGKDRME